MIIPKIIKYNILFYADPIILYMMAKQSMIVKNILNDKYFWKGKLHYDYPNFSHKNFENYFERYKRLHQGNSNEYILSYLDTIHVEFNEEELRTACVTDENLLLLTIMAIENFDCIRGDTVLVSRLKSNNDDRGKFIFDGKRLINMDFDHYDAIIPEQFKIFIEFPIKYWMNLYFGFMHLDKTSININFDNSKQVKLRKLSMVGLCHTIYCPFTIDNNQYYLLLDQNFIRYFKVEKPDKWMFKTVYKYNTIISNNKNWILESPLNNQNTLILYA